MELKSRVGSGLRTLAMRESNRTAARQASEELDLKNVAPNVCTLSTTLHFRSST